MQEQDVEQYSQMSELPEEILGPRAYTPGEAMEGEVVRVDPDGIIVNVGLKMEGVVTSDEMRSISAEELAGIKPGELFSVSRAGEHIAFVKVVKVWDDYSGAEVVEVLAGSSVQPRDSVKPVSGDKVPADLKALKLDSQKEIPPPPPPPWSPAVRPSTRAASRAHRRSPSPGPAPATRPPASPPARTGHAAGLGLLTAF